VSTDRPESPARWTFLPAAAAVSACSRFLTERLKARVEALGGAWVASAVDSVAVVAAPLERKVEVLGGPVTALCFDVLRGLLADDDRYLDVRDGEPPVWKVEADGFERPTLAYCAGPNKLVLLRRKGRRLGVVRSCDTGLGGHLLAANSSGNPLLPDGHHVWPVVLLERLAAAAERFDDRTGWPPMRFPSWVKRPVVRRLRITSGAQLRRLRLVFPEADLRPWDTYLRAESADPLDDRVAYSLEVGAPPWRWLVIEWRLRTGQRVQVTTDVKHRPGVLRLRTVEEYLYDWQRGHSFDELSTALGDQGQWRWQQRGLRDPVPVHSSPALTELCGRDGPLLDLAEFDPDADLKSAVALYGPAVLPKCAWPGCGEIVQGGRGSKKQWCANHARRSGVDRKRVRSQSAAKRRGPKCAWPGCNELVGATRGGTARWCPDHRAMARQQRRREAKTTTRPDQWRSQR
jgi:hypothetical protein